MEKREGERGRLTDELEFNSIISQRKNVKELTERQTDRQYTSRVSENVSKRTEKMGRRGGSGEQGERK